MASNRVFGIVELLENVLVNLDCIELLRVRHICTEFKNVVETSPTLRKIVWLDPPEVGRTAKLHPILHKLQSVAFQRYLGPDLSIDAERSIVIYGYFDQTLLGQHRIPTLWLELPVCAPTNEINNAWHYFDKTLRGRRLYKEIVDIHNARFTIGGMLRSMVKCNKEHGKECEPGRPFNTVVTFKRA